MSYCRPVNKSAFLINQTSISDVIQLRRTQRHIDRIQFSIMNQGSNYITVLNGITAQYKLVRTYSVDSKFIYKFMHTKGTMELIYYNKLSYSFVLSVSDPDDDVQIWLRMLFKSLNIDSNVSVSQIEFAFDIFPLNQRDIYKLSLRLSHSLVMRHARPGSFSCKGTTVYQGHKGNVRKGSKGLTCYVKNEDGCFRIELRANRKFLKKEMIDVDSLPIQADRIDIFRFLTLRRGLDEAAVKKLIRQVSKWQQVRSERQLSARAERVQKQFIKIRILENVSATSLCDSSSLSLWNTRPVAAQIDYVKALRREYGKPIQLDSYFPVVDINELVDDIQRAYVKMNY